MGSLIKHIKTRIHELEMEMNDHSEDVGEHTIYFAKMQGASVELLKLMQWIHRQELEGEKANQKTQSEVRRFTDWYKDNYGVELPDMVLQEYERYGAEQGRSEPLVCACKNAELYKDSLVPVYCHNCNAYVQTDAQHTNKQPMKLPELKP